MHRNYKMALARMRRVCEDIPEELRGTVILVFMCGAIIIIHSPFHFHLSNNLQINQLYACINIYASI